MKTPWALLAKYITGEASESERAEVDTWRKGSASNSGLLEKLRLLFKKNGSHYPIDFSRFKDDDWEKLIQKITSGTSAPTRWWPVWKVAASLSLFLVAGAIIFYFVKQQPLLEVTTADYTREIWLPDSSHVLLNKNSTLVVKAGYDQEVREVSLKGEAVFSVKPNPQHPFSVSSFDVRTTVLGTTFNVKARADSSVIVSVLEGKVKVAAKDDEHFITANMSTTFNGRTLQLSATADPNYLAWKTRVVRFENRALSDAVTFLAEHYGEAIVLGQDIDPNTLITVELNELSLDQSLEIITFTLDLQFEKGPKGYNIHKVKK